PADNSAMPSRGDIATGSGVGFLHVARGKNLLVENRNGADTIAAVFVRPNTRSDVIDGIDDIAISVVANGPMRPLRRIANDGQSGIDQQVQPVGCLFNKWATFKPDPTQILAAAERTLNDIG